MCLGRLCLSLKLIGFLMSENLGYQTVVELIGNSKQRIVRRFSCRCSAGYCRPKLGKIGGRAPFVDDVDIAVITTGEVSASGCTDIEAAGFDKTLKLQSSTGS